MWGVYCTRYTVYGILYTVHKRKEAMPKVTLYIREDDYDKWKLIKNKSELVSQAINSSIPFNELNTKEVSSNVRPPATYLEEAGYVDKKDVEKIIIPTDPKIKVQSTPKNNSEDKPSKRICPQHLVDKDVCKLMKHKEK